MNTFKRRILSAALLAGLAATCAFDASAQQTIGKIAGNIATSTNESMQLVNAIAYLLGGVAVLGAVYKFKQNREDPRSHPLSHAVGAGLAGILFIFLPEVISSGGATVWGGGGSTVVNPTSTTLQIK